LNTRCNKFLHDFSCFFPLTLLNMYQDVKKKQQKKIQVI